MRYAIRFARLGGFPAPIAAGRRDEELSDPIAESQPLRPDLLPVKNIEVVAKGADIQARIFTLAPGEAIPWHRHSESTDHYFVLHGTLTINTRKPDNEHILEIGGRYKITPDTEHLISNREATDCRFLLIQGVGKYDFIKSES